MLRTHNSSLCLLCFSFYDQSIWGKEIRFPRINQYPVFSVDFLIESSSSFPFKSSNGYAPTPRLNFTCSYSGCFFILYDGIPRLLIP